ncbi:MAG: hypothetical protein HPY85_11345 [Anaerolineae bacterium]|nr:hypothetical protein [Anaerolineae bacterium]
MSANKKATVNINRREYERLRQLERSTLFPPVNQNPGYNQAVETALLTQVDDLERKQREYQQMISGMSTEIQTLETEANRALLSQQQTFVKEMEYLEQNVALNTHQLLERQEMLFSQLVDEITIQTDDQIAELRTALTSYKEASNEKQQLADQMIGELEGIWLWHVDSYPWEQFLPGRIDDVERGLDLANRNYDMGNYESSILVCQQTLAEIQKLRIRLEKKQTEWSILLETARQHAQRLYQLGKENRLVYPVDVHGNVLVDQGLINVNYWSNGALSEYLDVMKTILGQLRDHPETMSCRGLREWIDQKVPIYEEELLDIVMIARENVIDSQLRSNIANIILFTMKQQGFEPVLIDEHSNEIKQPTRLVLRNPVGDEVTINLEPEGDNVGQNHISILSNENQPMDRHQLNERRRVVAESLGAYGVMVEQTDTPAIHADGTANLSRKHVLGEPGSSETKGPRGYQRHVSPSQRIHPKRIG